MASCSWMGHYTECHALCMGTVCDVFGIHFMHDKQAFQIDSGAIVLQNRLALASYTAVLREWTKYIYACREREIIKSAIWVYLTLIMFVNRQTNYYSHVCGGQYTENGLRLAHLAPVTQNYKYLRRHLLWSDFHAREINLLILTESMVFEWF